MSASKCVQAYAVKGAEIIIAQLQADYCELGGVCFVNSFLNYVVPKELSRILHVFQMKNARMS